MSVLGETDIYLIDQILKNRYSANDIILDAGCGSGRNLPWFIENSIRIYAVDINADVITNLKNKYPGLPANRFMVSGIETTNFTDSYFDHIICSAVLHFANGTAQFNLMLAELVRVLKPGGTLFIRMNTDIGIEDKVELIGDGVYTLPDGSTRFLLTRQLLANSMQQNNLSFSEPLKSVNVDDIRSMGTLLLKKN